MTQTQRDQILIDLLDAVTTLRTDIQRLRDQSTPNRDIDAALLKEIHRATGGLRFSVADLVTNSEVTALGAGDVALHDAICAAVDSLNARCLGNLLAELEGRPIAGFVVRRGKKTGAGVQWRVVMQK